MCPGVWYAYVVPVLAFNSIGTLLVLLTKFTLNTAAHLVRWKAVPGYHCLGNLTEEGGMEGLVRWTNFARVNRVVEF